MNREQVQGHDVDVEGPHVEGYGKIKPYTWKSIAALVAIALAQIAVELRRMADAKQGER
jgi:hypothetical protein